MLDNTDFLQFPCARMQFYSFIYQLFSSFNFVRVFSLFYFKLQMLIPTVEVAVCAVNHNKHHNDNNMFDSTVKITKLAVLKQIMHPCLHFLFYSPVKCMTVNSWIFQSYQMCGLLLLSVVGVLFCFHSLHIFCCYNDEISAQVNVCRPHKYFRQDAYSVE